MPPALSDSKVLKGPLFLPPSIFLSFLSLPPTVSPPLPVIEGDRTLATAATPSARISCQVELQYWNGSPSARPTPLSLSCSLALALALSQWKPIAWVCEREGGSGAIPPSLRPQAQPFLAFPAHKLSNSSCLLDLKYPGLAPTLHPRPQCCCSTARRPGPGSPGDAGQEKLGKCRLILTGSLDAGKVPGAAWIL